MKMKTKGTIIKILACFLLIFLVIGAIACNWNKLKLQMEFSDFRHALAQENLDNMHLLIYYMHPSILTPAPLRVEDLIRFSMLQDSSVRMITVGNKQLKEHTDLLNRVDANAVETVREKSPRIDARLCCIFETEQNGKVLEIAVGGVSNSVLVNGIEVEYSDIFRDIMEPFVTAEEMELLDYIFKGKLYLGE